MEEDLKRELSTVIIKTVHAKNPEQHASSKPIEIRYYFIREKINNREFYVDHILSEERKQIN